MKSKDKNKDKEHKAIEIVLPGIKNSEKFHPGEVSVLAFDTEEEAKKFITSELNPILAQFDSRELLKDAVEGLKGIGFPEKLFEGIDKRLGEDGDDEGLPELYYVGIAIRAAIATLLEHMHKQRKDTAGECIDEMQRDEERAGGGSGFIPGDKPVLNEKQQKEILLYANNLHEGSMTESKFLTCLESVLRD